MLELDDPLQGGCLFPCFSGEHLLQYFGFPDPYVYESLVFNNAYEAFVLSNSYSSMTHNFFQCFFLIDI
jgi:hypothetical protein